MAVYSMTGYANAQKTVVAAGSSTSEVNGAANQGQPQELRLGLEIRSVNSRFLDVSFRLPDELRTHEPALRALLVAQLKRGKVEVRASLSAEAATALTEPAPHLLQRVGAVQNTVRAWLPDAQPLSVMDVLRLCSAAGAPQPEWGEPLMVLAQQVLADLRTARVREGGRLAAMLRERLEQVGALARQAVPLVPQLVEQQRQRFVQRWREAIKLAEGGSNATASVALETAQDRALTEATAFALRIDVAEEITRLQAHLDEIARLLDKGGDIGKRLDFLIQELHREANTLGSKSATLELTRIGVDMKVLIEQMREQVQNIE